MLTKGVHNFKKDININTTGDGPTLGGESIPTSSIVPFPEVLDVKSANFISYPKAKSRHTSSPTRLLLKETVQQQQLPTCEKNGNVKRLATPVLKSYDVGISELVKEPQFKADNLFKDQITHHSRSRTSPKGKQLVSPRRRKLSCKISRCRQEDAAKAKLSSKTEWLISFSTLDSQFGRSSELPQKILKPKPVIPVANFCARKPSPVSSSSNSSVSSAGCHHPGECVPTRPYSACLKKAPMVNGLKLKRSPSLSLNSSSQQTVPFSSLKFEAKGFYSVKQRQRPASTGKELAVVEGISNQRESSKLTGVWKSLKTLAWRDTKRKDDPKPLNDSQYSSSSSVLLPISRGKPFNPAQNFTNSIPFSNLESSLYKSQVLNSAYLFCM